MQNFSDKEENLIEKKKYKTPEFKEFSSIREETLASFSSSGADNTYYAS